MIALRLARLRLPARPNRPTRRARGRAKAAVLSGLATVLIAHVGLAVRVETRRPTWRDPEYFLREHRLVALSWWAKADGRARPLVVAVGGSRTQMGWSPGHLGFGSGPTDPIAFNCAQAGALPVGERLNLARLFAAGMTPDFVLIEVLPPVLADPGPMEERIPLPRLGLADLARVAPYHTDRARTARRWASARARSWTTLRLPLLAAWELSDSFPPGPDRPDRIWAATRADGWGPFHPAGWPDASRAAGLATARGSYEWLLRDFRVEPVNDRLVRDMLADCRSRGVRAALYTMPESPTFRSWYPPAARAQVREYLSAVGRDAGVPVFDTSDWVNDEAAFTDGHHLLGPAAEAFSARFGRECVGPWVATGGR